MKIRDFKFLHFNSSIHMNPLRSDGKRLFVLGLAMGLGLMMARGLTQSFGQEAATKPAASPSPSSKEFPAVEFNDPAFQFRSVTPTKKGGIVIRALKADQNLPQRLELIVRDKDGNEKKVELSALNPQKKGPKLPEFRGHFTPESGDWGSVIGLELRFALPQLGGKKAITGTTLDSPVSTNP